MVGPGPANASGYQAYKSPRSRKTGGRSLFCRWTETAVDGQFNGHWPLARFAKTCLNVARRLKVRCPR